jgi:hypothetical protein
MSGAKARLFSAVLMLVTLVPISFILAIAVFIYFDHTSETLRYEALHFLYFAVFWFWVTTPIIGFRSNEFLDTTKLFTFPVSHRTVFVSTLLGSFTSGALLFWIPSLAAATATIGHDSSSAAATAAHGTGAVACRYMLLLPAMIVLAQTATQCLTLALLNLLRTRRFRDVALIVGAVIVASMYVSFRLCVERLGGQQVSAFLGSNFSRFLVFSPSYWISRAVVAPAEETIGAVLTGLGSVGALTIGLVFLGAWLQKKAYYGEIPFSQPTKRDVARARREADRPTSRLLPDDVSAVMAAELRILRREPAVKTQLISQATYLVIPIAISILSPSRGHGGMPIGSFVFPGILAALSFAEAFLFLNLFGLDGAGINLLFSTPMPRRRIFLGKDLAYVTLFGAVNVLVLLVLSLVLKFVSGVSWVQAAADFSLFAFLAIALLVVLVSLGNVFSVLLPMRMLARGRRALGEQSVEREGCAKAMMRALSLLAVVVYLFPVFVLLMIPREPIRLVGSWFYAVGIPASVLYAAATWIVSLRIGESMLAKREHRLVAFYTSSPQ